MENENKFMYVVFKIPVGNWSPQKAKERLYELVQQIMFTDEDKKAMGNLHIKQVILPVIDNTADVIIIYPPILSDDMKSVMESNVIAIEEYVKKFLKTNDNE